MLIIGAFAIVSGVMTGNVVVAVLHENGQSLPDSPSISPTEAPKFIPFIETIDIAVGLSFCMGIYLITLGLLRVGFLSIFLSQQLISGFAASASFYVLGSQFRYLFGNNSPLINSILFNRTLYVQE